MRAPLWGTPLVLLGREGAGRCWMSMEGHDSGSTCILMMPLDGKNGGLGFTIVRKLHASVSVNVYTCVYL